MKLNIVFEYIFQQCYLKLYPGLQDILQEPNGEFGAPFNGGQYPSFNIATDLLEFFEHNKMYICEAVNERFPFLHGLHDLELLSHKQLLKLLADRRLTTQVLYDALCDIQDIKDVESFFAYLFQEFYLKLYPKLHTILKCLNVALSLDVCPPTPVSRSDKSTEASKRPIADSRFSEMVKNETMEEFEESSNEPSTVLYEDETNDIEENDYNEPSRVSAKEKTLALPEPDFMDPSPITPNDETHKKNSHVPLTGSDETLPTPVRKCRLQPINYYEPPDFDVEVKDGERKRKVPEHSKGHKHGRSKTQQTNIAFFTKSRIHLNDKYEAVQVIKPVSVKVEFPKQVFNEKFRVRCGEKMGIFKKSLWTGGPRHFQYSPAPRSGAAPSSALTFRQRARTNHVTAPSDLSVTAEDAEDRAAAGMGNSNEYAAPPLWEVEPHIHYCNERYHATAQYRKKLPAPGKRRAGTAPDSSKDLCIRCEEKKFSVITFEKYGGKASSKNWKKSIQCEEIKLECLFKITTLPSQCTDPESDPDETMEPRHERYSIGLHGDTEEGAQDIEEEVIDDPVVDPDWQLLGEQGAAGSSSEAEEEEPQQASTSQQVPSGRPVSGQKCVAKPKPVVGQHGHPVKVAQCAMPEKGLNAHIARLISLEMMPYRLVESEAFKALMDYAVPRYELPSRHRALHQHQKLEFVHRPQSHDHSIRSCHCCTRGVPLWNS
ncbi:unnamed protein product [Ranitomeya imitator]|uniref:Uncharacterized protein n=1 Tax=Ranitomeya imitator TaxID=111125 RepID=A0ABN9M170_9NEOB|nr:unnamed protein product [Ranitomeya imitator]